jgi:hypothetical protein
MITKGTLKAGWVRRAVMVLAITTGTIPFIKAITDKGWSVGTNHTLSVSYLLHLINTLIKNNIGRIEK